MEKLIELLNEYMQPYIKYKGWNVPGRYFINYDEGADLHEEEVISKKFGFIKWLVENEKIDYEKVRSGEGNGSRWHFETVQPEYYIIMLLSIQDEPISFLVSILK